MTTAELLTLALQFESHADNLAAALYGGVCISWRSNGDVHASRIALDLPLASILAVPAERANTAESRNGLPASVPHKDAALTAAHAVMLGAAIAAGDADLLRSAFHDRLHEPYRVAATPLLQLLQSSAPAGAAGVTLSGSGPSVVVWAARDQADGVRSELERSLPAGTRVLRLRVAKEGAKLA